MNKLTQSYLATRIRRRLLDQCIRFVMAPGHWMRLTSKKPLLRGSLLASDDIHVVSTHHYNRIF